MRRRVDCMADIDPALLRRLEREREVKVRTPRRNGSTADLPIWIVTIDGDAYVRSYLGDRGAWYCRARADGQMTLVVGGEAMPVAVEPVADQALNRRISDAYTAKYSHSGPALAMVSQPVVATTLRVSPTT